ncbi:MAG: nucleotidyltransferase family protein [Bacteroidales bacterium]|nr:nucleotidyltransferase family protein [Bacteroidales bacterium]
MKAMIFAAGLGKRLGEVTKSIPKALVEVSGKTVLHLAVEKCASYDFDDIIINVHHFADLVENEVYRLRKMGFRISISDERDLLLETGGGLYKAKKFFDDSPFLLYNVDILTDLDLADLYRYHIKTGSLATLAVRNREDFRYFLTDRSGLLKGWCNKSTGEKIITGNTEDSLSEIAFSGIHIADPEIFRYMEPGIYSMTTLYLKISESARISVYVHNGGYWFDIGNPESLEIARKYLKKI